MADKTDAWIDGWLAHKAGEIAADDAAFVFRALSPDAWEKALKRRRRIEEREAEEDGDQDA